MRNDDSLSSSSRLKRPKTAQHLSCVVACLTEGLAITIVVFQCQVPEVGATIGRPMDREPKQRDKVKVDVKLQKIQKVLH